MNILEFKYEDDDIISETIINFYINEQNKQIESFIERYINNKKFFEFIQKNFLVNKISESYLLRLYNDYDEENVIDEYDYITSINTTRWI